jgi:hypothetical protein
MRRPLTIPDILLWADGYREATGRWPTQSAGPVAGAIGETWRMVDSALRTGTRGLPGGSSLAQLLVQQRGARNRRDLPPLSTDQILAWADDHQRRTGAWPTAQAGPVGVARGENWQAVSTALRVGVGGLPGGSSLARLLAERRGVRNRKALPPLTEDQILVWADEHRARTGAWPVRTAGPVTSAPGETWAGVNRALSQGVRGLRGRSTLARLLAERRGKRHHLDLPKLSQKKILKWADAHFHHSGRWPNGNSGPVTDAPGERWDALDNALRLGQRGLPGGSSLRRLLARKRGLRHPLALLPLTEEQVLQWAERHRQRTGAWPKSNGGPVVEAPGATWAGLNAALTSGKRGLPGGSSLAQLLRHAQRAAP